MIGSSGSGVVRTISVGSSGPDPVDPGVSVDFVDIDFVSDFVPNITEKTTKKTPSQHNYQTRIIFRYLYYPMEKQSVTSFANKYLIFFQRYLINKLKVNV